VRRRDFLSLMGLAASWPLAAAAQLMPVVGILDPDVTFIFDAFVEGMRALGYVEGRNIAYVRRRMAGRPENVPAVAAELVDLKVDIIVTAATFVIRAAARATTSIPIVFLAAGDPVSSGLVSSLAHPGGNLTGLSFLDDELSAKRLELLRDLVPNLRYVAVFQGPGAERPTALITTEEAAQKLGLQIRYRQLSGVDAFDAAFQEAAASHVDAADFMAHPYFNANRDQLARLAAKYRMPAIYESADYVRSGCLMGYGPDFAAMARRGAAFVDRILKGEKPSDLPVEITTKFELSINLKAAEALGLAIPTTLLARADVVVE
jgi:putative tryptophan/tyrosine transport system substrate-binding protein